MAICRSWITILSTEIRAPVLEGMGIKKAIPAHLCAGATCPNMSQSVCFMLDQLMAGSAYHMSSAKVPVMRKNHMQCMMVRAHTGDDPVLSWFVDMSPTIQSEKAHWHTIVDQAMADSLHGSLDGIAL